MAARRETGEAARSSGSSSGDEKLAQVCARGALRVVAGDDGAAPARRTRDRDVSPRGSSIPTARAPT
jgi:hypothetical protein